MTVRIVPMTAPEVDEVSRAELEDGDSGIGALRTERGNLPLEQVDLHADISGLTSRVELVQTFRNSHRDPLEAVYVFPLPDRAAVIGLGMTSAGREVQAVLRERGAARQAYAEAMAAGQRAALAEEERPDVFTMRVGNVLPGESATVTLTLVGVLPVQDGEATFRFPLVVAPRYIPGTPVPGECVGEGTARDTEAVPDASRITPPVLLPGSPHAVVLNVDVAVAPSGVLTGEARSSLHVMADEGGRYRLRPGERADRDLVLRLPLASGPLGGLAQPADPEAEGASPLQVGGCLTVAAEPDPQQTGDAGEATFELTVLPPAEPAATRARDVVLLLDRSGSMSGWKMVAARRAAARIVDTLTTEDRFAVMTFDTRVEQPPRIPGGLVPGTDRLRYRAVEYLARVEARGGTNLLTPLSRAIDLLRVDTEDTEDTEARDRVIVLVTDGQVGNEDHILAHTAAGLAGLRVHTVGIDQAVNAGFLGRLASIGGGRCELVESEDRLDTAMERIHRRMRTPVISQVTLDLAAIGARAETVTPRRLPDLFHGIPYVVRGRCRADARGEITLSGLRPDRTRWSVRVPVTPGVAPATRPVWARAHLRDLEDAYASAGGGHQGGELREDLERRIVATSLRFGVLCRFTAYVVVDHRVVAGGDDRITVVQPVAAPGGWELEDPSGPTIHLAAMTMAAPAARSARPPKRRWVAEMPQRMVSPGQPAPSAAGAAAAGGARSLAVPPATGGSTDLRAWAASELDRLGQDESLPWYRRYDQLEDLGTRLAALLAGSSEGVAAPVEELARLVAEDNLQRVARDERGVRECLAEALRLLRAIAGGEDQPDARRESFWRR